MLKCCVALMEIAGEGNDCVEIVEVVGNKEVVAELLNGDWNCCRAEV